MLPKCIEMPTLRRTQATLILSKRKPYNLIKLIELLKEFRACPW
jgi:hypothetical protein